MIRLLFLLMLYTAAAHAERPADYAFGVPLLPGDATAFQRVAVPAVVHEGTVKRDLADLRIFNGDGEVVPYAWIPRRPLPRGRPPAITLPMFPLYTYRDRKDVAGLALTVVRNASGTTVRVDAPDSDPAGARVLGGYVLDASAQDEPLTALTFTLPEVAGATTMRLRIDASDDLASWHGIAADATLVNLEYGGQRLTRNRIEFSPARTKYLRLSWDVDRPAIEFSAVSGEFGERAVETPREWRNADGKRSRESRRRI